MQPNDRTVVLIGPGRGSATSSWPWAIDTAMGDPLTERFESVFRRIHAERMSGLPLVNPALRVWVSDWREWEERRIGVLLTPWSMSLVCVPGVGGGPGVEHRVRLPSGVYCFVEAEEAEIGEFALCLPIHYQALAPGQVVIGRSQRLPSVPT